MHRFQKKKCITGLLLLLLVLNGKAQAPLAPGGEESFRIGIYTGYRSENVRWSVAGNPQGQDPNIYSELIWQGLSGPLFAADLRWKIYRSFLVTARLSDVTISDGHATDADYQGDNRTDRSYYGYFDAGHGSLVSGDVQLGYRFKIGRKIYLVPGLGYGIDREALFLLPYKGTAPDSLRTTYTALWKGVLLSMAAIVPLGTHLQLEPSLTYHQLTYTGSADWNIIPNFQHPLSFKDNANGYGIVPSAELRYSFQHRWSLSIHGNYGWWSTGTGVEHLYEANGQTALTQFNGAKRTGFETGAGVQFHW